MKTGPSKTNHPWLAGHGGSGRSSQRLLVFQRPAAHPSSLQPRPTFSHLWAENKARLLALGRPLLVVATALIITAAPHELVTLILHALSGAYLSVTVYVAATMIPIHWFSQRLHHPGIEKILQNRFLRIPLAALLGASPGCGGAIVVTTAFARGKLCFSSVVAVLTATMGDAAFLLIARSPATAVMMMGIGCVVGTCMGWFCSLIHSQDFLRPTPKTNSANVPASSKPTESLKPTLHTHVKRASHTAWWTVFAMGAAVLWLPESAWTALGISVQSIAVPVGVFGALLCMVNWAFTSNERTCGSTSSHDSVESAVTTTNRVTIWVIAAFLIFEVGSLLSPISMHEAIGTGGVWMPALGALVGLFPSCGPQVVLTELFLRGAISFPSLVANGISNDGDAIFPMLVIAPRAATLSLFYTLAPALLVGYGLYCFSS